MSESEYLKKNDPESHRAEPSRMLFCSHGNHFEGTSTQLYITMYFLYKQKCSLLTNRIQGNVVTALCGRGPHTWVTRQQQTVELTSPHCALSTQPSTLPSPGWGLGVSRTASGEDRVEEEMLFAF